MCRIDGVDATFVLYRLLCWRMAMGGRQRGGRQWTLFAGVSREHREAQPCQGVSRQGEEVHGVWEILEEI